MNDVGKAYQDIQSHFQLLLQIVIQSWVRLGINFFFFLGAGAASLRLFASSRCFLSAVFSSVSQVFNAALQRFPSHCNLCSAPSLPSAFFSLLRSSKMGE
jgi:hypothetical protein